MSSFWNERVEGSLGMVGIYRAIPITQIFKAILSIEHKSSPYAVQMQLTEVASCSIQEASYKIIVGLNSKSLSVVSSAY